MLINYRNCIFKMHPNERTRFICRFTDSLYNMRLCKDVTTLQEEEFVGHKELPNCIIRFV